ncbi:DUF5680 domain-containing protein [Bifidobacterium sp. ESL0728]|uniref:DUF5680 domain-containing protein n=1 Tax=Bifidobacterium sp. ESL0728 TaxID=2983220 RepID=UPI0023F6FB73|nr:DUF5680 domain-containing protein [Bifidobacterium sp. ESL0728]WEV58975.1 DUF5680 domain-containing protein [Bifidobacterium sp. ESL0728]
MPLTSLPSFLVAAKAATYAAEKPVTLEPTFSGSHEFRFTKGNLHYRDIYFGSLHFAGQEIVEDESRAIWSMVYLGGILQNGTAHNADNEDDNATEIYRFLKLALRKASPDAPYRGPASFEAGEYRYTNQFTGDITNFNGKETIYAGQLPVYRLHYSGGYLQ